MKQSAKLFLIDSSGALLTALLLIFVVRKFENFFGMPEKSVFVLTSIAFCLFLLSFSCYFLVKVRFSLFLRIIAAGNLIYCLVTFLICFASENLTTFGWIYFSAEILIIVTLTAIELRFANKWSEPNKTGNL